MLQTWSLFESFTIREKKLLALVKGTDLFNKGVHVFAEEDTRVSMLFSNATLLGCHILHTYTTRLKISSHQQAPLA